MDNVLNLPGWIIRDTQETRQGYQFVAVYQIASPCIYCQSPDLQKFGRKDQFFIDLPMHGKRVGIQVQRQRYRCKQCHHTLLQLLPDMDDKRLMTMRLITYIQEQSLHRTFVSIAAEVGLDEKTIRNIFHDYVVVLEATHVFQTPRWLGIDELMLVRKQRCIMTNVQAGTIIALLPTRTQTAVARFLSEMPDRHQIEVVCMDMWAPYRDAVRACLPSAMIIVDKFHVVRMANQALEAVRKTVRSSLTDRQRRTLMHDRYVLLRRRRDLDERGQLVLAAWTQSFPELAQAYALKERFYDIWNASGEQEARMLYQDWIKRIPDALVTAFKPLTTAMENWQQEIFAYFTILGASATNATTEALNGIAKLANRTGRGYSFEAVRAKLLYAKRSPTTKYSLRSRFVQAQDNLGVKLDEVFRLIAEHERLSLEVKSLMRDTES